MRTDLPHPWTRERAFVVVRHNICRVRITWFQTYLIHSTSRAGDNQEGWLPPSSDSEKRGRRLAAVRKAWDRAVWSESEWVWCAARERGFALSCMEYILNASLTKHRIYLWFSPRLYSVPQPSQANGRQWLAYIVCTRWHVYTLNAGVPVNPASETTSYFQDIDRGVMLNRNKMTSFTGHLTMFTMLRPCVHRKDACPKTDLWINKSLIICGSPPAATYIYYILVCINIYVEVGVGLQQRRTTLLFIILI